MGRDLLATVDIQTPTAPNPLGPHFPSPAHSPQPAPPLATQTRILSASLLGANPNPRSATEGPFPRSLVLQHWGLGAPEHQ